jgi:alkaline phosphatase D
MQFNRRQFLKTIAISAAAGSSTAITGCIPATENEALLPANSNPFFPQSLMSGDPRPDSIVLWTRVEDSALGDDDASVQLQIALDDGFNNQVLTQDLQALAINDHCLKLRITELEADTRYYFRFIYLDAAAGPVSSNTGRTKTAPNPDSERAVKYAFVSCQDYIGRYFNSYIKLLETDDLDFIVHLGDYIYETTGDPRFQDLNGPRQIRFDDQDGAMQIGSGESAFYAAASLDNYRQLYKTYRADTLLQRIHEKFPLIAMWDDHEFSDDCWGTNASYYGGAVDEEQLIRRHNAEQAYFDYMPVDQEAAANPAYRNQSGDIPTNNADLYPNARIYREFQFGQHLQLLTSDFRSFRPDHLIPESAFPGKVIMDESEMEHYFSDIGEDYAAQASRYSPYIDPNASPYADNLGLLNATLQANYLIQLQARSAPGDQEARATELSTEALSGFITLASYNQLVADTIDILQSRLEPIPESLQPIDENSPLPYGMAYSSLGKADLLGEVGSRYFIVKENLDIYADYHYRLLNNTDSQNGYGDDQKTWLESRFSESLCTWKVLASSVSFSPLVVNLDLSIVPEAFRWKYYINADHWDGFPNEKRALLNDLLSEHGVITIAGDVHSAYVSEHHNRQSGKRSVDFTSSSISSGTLGTFVADTVENNASIGDLKPLLPFLEAVVKTSSEHRMTEMYKHGVAIVSASADGFDVDYHFLEGEFLGQNYIQQNLYFKPSKVLGRMNSAANIKRFSLDSATRTLRSS